MLLVSNIICRSCDRNGITRFDCSDSATICICPKCECLSECIHENVCICCFICSHMITIRSSQDTSRLCSKCNLYVSYKFYYFGNFFGQDVHINIIDKSWEQIHINVEQIFNKILCDLCYLLPVHLPCMDTFCLRADRVKTK